MAPKLILTGFMATGKSAVARALCRILRWRLVDCDRELAARSGKSIPAIFMEEGEARFRELERQIILEIVNDPRRCAQCKNPRPAVVATGGGALVDEKNYRALSKAGVIICLSSRPEVIARRITRSREVRPKLLETGKPIEERIAELMAERRSAYARAAATVDTSDLTIEQAAEAVLSAFVALGRRQCGLFS
jgi:shikimate kinase